MMSRALFCGVILVNLVLSYGSVEDRSVSSVGSAITDLSIKYMKQYHKGLKFDSFLYNSQTVYKMILTLYFTTTGQTRREVEKLLGLKMNYSEVLERFRYLEGQTIPGVIEGYRLYHDSRYKLNKTVQAVLGDHVAAINFSDAFVTDKINDWTKKVTKGEILNMYHSDLEDNTTMVLVGATFIKLMLKANFGRVELLDRGFYLLTGVETNNTFLKYEGSFGYRDSKLLDCEIFKISYENERFSFVVFLPRNTSNITLFVNSVNYTNFNSELKSTVLKDIVLTLPEFSTQRKMNMESVLSQWGLPNTLSAGAEFGAFANRSGLLLDRITSAEDVQIFMGGNNASSVSHPYNVTVERPFVHMVYDNITDSLLYLAIDMYMPVGYS